VGESSRTQGSSLAARAAAVSAAAAAWAGAAQAEIVYTPGPFTYNNNADSTNSIDFDHNGSREADMAHLDAGQSHVLKEGVAARPVFYVDGPGSDPANLAFGTPIGDLPGLAYIEAPDIGDTATLLSYTGVDVTTAKDGGNFSPNSLTPEYLGVRFQLAEGGPSYYGWIGLQNMINPDPAVADNTIPAGVISGYAYNDQAGQPIAAGQTTAVPEPTGLALLALGAGGLALRRGKRP
jgi:hypothetical protein